MDGDPLEAGGHQSAQKKASLRNLIGLFHWANPKKMASRVSVVYAPVGWAGRIEVQANPYYVHCQCRARRGCNQPGEKTGHDNLHRS